MTDGLRDSREICALWSMQATLQAMKTEITNVFEDLERQRQSLGIGVKETDA